MPFHEFDALGDPLTGIRFAIAEFFMVAQYQPHQMGQRMRGVDQMRHREPVLKPLQHFLKQGE